MVSQKAGVLTLEYPMLQAFTFVTDLWGWNSKLSIEGEPEWHKWKAQTYQFVKSFIPSFLLHNKENDGLYFEWQLWNGTNNFACGDKSLKVTDNLWSKFNIFNIPVQIIPAAKYTTTSCAWTTLDIIIFQEDGIRLW